jgi:hypothetical protein
VGLGATYAYTPPGETLAATSSRLNSSEALSVCVVLAHRCISFHPCTCGLHVGIAAVVTILIDYDDHGGCYWNEHEAEMIMNDYFLYIDA